MQDYKKAQTAKSTNIKNSLGSPNTKIKPPISPKNNPTFPKSPGGPTSPKTQWKTQNSINTALQSSHSVRTNSSKLSINNEEQNSFKMTSKQSDGYRKTKIGSPKNTFKGSKLAINSKLQEKNQQKSAVFSKCPKCESKEEQLQLLNKQFEEKIANLEKNLTEAKEEAEKLKKEKKDLEDKVEKFSGVLAENRKLIREKAMKFNNEGEQIKKLNDRIIELEGIVEVLLLQKGQREKQTSHQIKANLNQFGNLLQIESQIVGVGQKDEGQSEEKMFRKQKDESKTESIQSAGAQRQEVENGSKQLQKIKREYNESLSEIQKDFENKSSKLQEQIEQKQKIISQLKYRVEKMKCESQQRSKISQIPKRNHLTFQPDEKKDFSKKQSLNNSTTNKSSPQDCPMEFATHNFSNVENTSMLVKKLDRIKRISERQNQIIMQIKQSSKISYCSELSMNKSSISLILDD